VETVLGGQSQPTSFTPVPAMGGAGGCTLLKDDGDRCHLVY